MSGTCVIGLQWGDEAKGKLVDLLAPQFDLVVRYQGGANAGHTVVAGDETYKLHHIPSGILHPQVRNLITPGVVINPSTMLDEIEGLAKRGVICRDNLRISERAHLVMPWHMAEDKFINATAVRGESIGTTNRGIGPCYRDKVGRTHAIRMADLVQATRDDRIATVAEQKVAILEKMGAPQEDLDAIAPGKVVAMAASWAEQLDGMIGDTTDYLLDACESDKRILFEGAQGALLDIDHGTFPFVTSSVTSRGNATHGAGIHPGHVTDVIGITKAYITRVGNGAMPTELEDAAGEHLGTVGHEFGTTTGRKRRCGWFDAVVMRHAHRINGFTSLALTKLDVLGGLDELKICVAYELDGAEITEMPSSASALARCKPIYMTVPGFESKTLEEWLVVARHANENGLGISSLPESAQDYVRQLESLLGIPCSSVGVGPDRDATIDCN